VGVHRRCALLAVVALAACDAEPTPVEEAREELQIDSVALPGRLWDPLFPPLDSGSPVTIGGALTIPAADGPVPAVIIEHGCGGAGTQNEWVPVLADAGIATVALDSFSGRGVQQLCSGKETLNVADLIIDVYRTADLLRDDPRIDGDRIAVMGHSFGGRTALWSSLRRAQDAYDGTPFAGYVAFYPATCFIQLEDEVEVAGGPIRILHGTDDDWTPIAQCDALIGRLDAAGVDAAIHRYEGALHGFDIRGLAWAVRHVQPSAVSPRSCTFVERDGTIVDAETGGIADVGAPCVERGVTLGFDADARASAEDDLLTFLDEIFEL
jgi:dienelactone hydrolase